MATNRRKLLWTALALGATLLAWFAAEVWHARPQDARRGAVAAKVKEWCCVAAVRFPLNLSIAADAQAFLAKAAPPRLTEPLETILADPAPPPASQPHPLLGKPAPDFALPNDKGKPIALAGLRKHGPVVVVFYYGYWCDHCVAQLFALNRDLSYFEELGAQVVAISADPPKLTTERFAQYGRFAFPTVSDDGHRVARAWGTSKPGAGPDDEAVAHGTFLVDRAGVVRWANVGPQPFLEHRGLLKELAKLADE